MKTHSLILTLSICSAWSIRGQTTSPATVGTTATATATPYSVVANGPNHRIWQSTTYEVTPDGKTLPHLQQYEEVATGLNHLVNGQWVESKEEIDILPDGTAAATNGQHQVYFPGDIYQGAILLVTPEGKQLTSRPLGLSYDDGTKTVLIAELTNSVGLVVGANQVFYPNAFSGLKGSLRYVYTKAGFEQDLILLESPLTPESYGLNPATAKLQLLTEFFNPPPPAMTTAVLPKQAGIALTDENLDFGVMKMTQGRAFLLGADAHAEDVIVGKSWLTLSGRQFLVEQVPVEALALDLAQLPAPQTASVRPNRRSGLHVVSAKRRLPAKRLAKSGSSGRFTQVAQTAIPVRGLVLDYNIVTSQTNYTFQGDTTYFVSGAVNLSGTNTFEGGAVIKYTNGASITVQASNLNWRAGPYRPVVFTAWSDDSVGSSITGSTGNPNGYYANPALSLTSGAQTPTISGLRVSYRCCGFFAI